MYGQREEVYKSKGKKKERQMPLIHYAMPFMNCVTMFLR